MSNATRQGVQRFVRPKNSVSPNLPVPTFLTMTGILLIDITSLSVQALYLV